MDIRAKWKQLAAGFDAKSQRERILLAVAAVGGVLLVGNALLVDPSLSRARQLQRLTEQAQADIATVGAQAEVVRAQLRVDPDAGRKAEIQRLKDSLRTLEGDLKSLEDRFVPPGQMNELLENLLARHARLRLVSLRSVPPVNLAQAAPQANSTGGQPAEVANLPDALGLYKHGVELRLEGSYADLHAWLSQLETSQRKLLWGDVRFSVVEYPRAVMTLTVYTLSTDKAWLAI